MVSKCNSPLINELPFVQYFYTLGNNLLDYVVSEKDQGITPVYKHHNNTIRLTIQYKAALTTCKHKYEVVSAAFCCIVRRIVLL